MYPWTSLIIEQHSTSVSFSLLHSTSSTFINVTSTFINVTSTFINVTSTFINVTSTFTNVTLHLQM